MDRSQNASPGVSIITPTHKRVDLVTQLLVSLQSARQRYPGETEVLIVDSSPGFESEQILKACKDRDATYHAMSNNVRQKRNWGIENAQYPVILFIDSDCIADENLINEHARFYESDAIPELGGVVGLTNFVGADNWVWRIIQRSSTLDVFSYPKCHKVVPWGPTCNISYRREVLEEVGLFDETFPFVLGGDDTDLGLRVTDSGHKILTNELAIVDHEKRTWTRVYDIVQRRFRWGRMHYYLMQKHSHRVTVVPPTQTTIFLVLAFLFLPLAFFSSLFYWAFFPLLWLILEILFEALFNSRGKGRQPVEFFYAMGASALTLLYQVGTIVEGMKNLSVMPLFKDASITPPSKDGRVRGLAQLWAKIMAFPISVMFLLLVQFILGS